MSWSSPRTHLYKGKAKPRGRGVCIPVQSMWVEWQRVQGTLSGNPLSRQVRQNVEGQTALCMNVFKSSFFWFQLAPLGLKETESVRNASCLLSWWLYTVKNFVHCFNLSSRCYTLTWEWVQDLPFFLNSELRQNLLSNGQLILSILRNVTSKWFFRGLCGLLEKNSHVYFLQEWHWTQNNPSVLLPFCVANLSLLIF